MWVCLIDASGSEEWQEYIGVRSMSNYEFIGMTQHPLVWRSLAPHHLCGEYRYSHDDVLLNLEVYIDTEMVIFLLDYILNHL